LRGAVTVLGQVTMTGSSDYSILNYDKKVLDDLRSQHTYRIAGAISRF
jgi:hypothetical protein